MSVSAGILVGGASRRMGRPKALILSDGLTILERVCAAAAGVADEIILLGTPPFELPTRLAELPVLPDLTPDIGPIGGLEAILAARPNCKALLLACDMPFVTTDVLRRLVDEPGDADAAVCLSEDEDGPRVHPCCGLYHPHVLPAVRAAIDSGLYGLVPMLARLKVRFVRLDAATARCVENWNTPGEVARDSRND